MLEQPRTLQQFQGWADKQMKKATGDEIEAMVERNNRRLADVTEEEWQEIAAERDKWLDTCVRTYPDDEIRQIVYEMYDYHNTPLPAVVITRSPPEAMHAAVKLHRTFNWSQYKDMPERKILSAAPTYSAVWWRSWGGWYRAAIKKFDLEYDAPSFELFLSWVQKIPFVYTWEGTAIVSQNPIFVSYNEDNQAHCEDGPALKFCDGVEMYLLENQHVTRQVVMEPETLTHEEIHRLGRSPTDEDPSGAGNMEAQRIAIERWGWDNYLAGATVVCQGKNPVDGTIESLMDIGNRRYFVGPCPTTARVYAMDILQEIDTLDDAREWLKGQKKVKSDPSADVVRTGKPSKTVATS